MTVSLYYFDQIKKENVFVTIPNQQQLLYGWGRRLWYENCPLLR